MKSPAWVRYEKHRKENSQGSFFFVFTKEANVISLICINKQAQILLRAPKGSDNLKTPKDAASQEGGTTAHRSFAG